MDALDLTSLTRLDRYPIAITVADLRSKDEPLTHANAAFCELTGYSRDEIIGKNCRFLQGTETDEDVVARLRASIGKRERCTNILKNYRKDGSTFHNLLVMGPLDETLARDVFVGCQYEFKLNSANKIVFEHLNELGAAVSSIAGDSRATWYAYIQNLVIKSVTVTNLIKSYQVPRTAG